MPVYPGEMGDQGMKTFTEVAWTKALKPSPKLLLLILARRSEQSLGVCAVSIPDLAAEMGTSKMTVFSAIETLINAGLLMVSRSKHAEPNCYCLMLEVWE
jgi:DNA-binding MarR family transcriptional regulator